jgi:thymidylate kinase
MITSFQRTIALAEREGFEALAKMNDETLAEKVTSLGMASTRVRYFRSVKSLVDRIERGELPDPRTADSDEAIATLRTHVWGASYKVAQCAVLYVKGYHCGIIPVDSGMVTMLGPCLGIQLPRGDVAHEQMRRIIEGCIKLDANGYRELAAALAYSDAIKLPNTAPTWWAHLALIYYKRHFCNRHRPEACALRGSDAGTCIGAMCARTEPARGGVRRLIIEGIDGVGKSSLAALLAKDGFAVRHFPHDPDLADLQAAYRARIEATDEPEVWDRSFISEYVYGNALRGVSRVSLQAILSLAQLHIDRGGAIAFLDAGDDAIRKRLSDDGRSGDFDAARHEALLNQYRSVAATLREAGLAEVFDTTDASIAEVQARVTRDLAIWRAN